MDCQQSVHFCVQGSTGGGQKVEPEDESCQSGRKRGPPCCARTKWQTKEPQKSKIWSSWCGVLRKRLFLLYSVQCTLQRGHLLAKRFALKVIGMRMLISSLNNECKKSCCILLQLLMNYPWPWRVLIGRLLLTFLFCQNLPQKSTIGEKWNVFVWKFEVPVFEKISWRHFIWKK